jgi:hypothetical protein
VAAIASVGCAVVIAVVAGRTVVRYIGVCPIKDVIVVVISKCGRVPARVGRVTRSAIGRKCQIYMVRVGGLVVVGLVASGTGVRRVVVIAVVAGVAIISDVLVCAVERVETAVVKIGRGPGSFCMAVLAIHGKL